MDNNEKITIFGFSERMKEKKEVYLSLRLFEKCPRRDVCRQLARCASF